AAAGFRSGRPATVPAGAGDRPIGSPFPRLLQRSLQRWRRIASNKERNDLRRWPPATVSKVAAASCTELPRLGGSCTEVGAGSATSGRPVDASYTQRGEGSRPSSCRKIPWRTVMGGPKYDALRNGHSCPSILPVRAAFADRLRKSVSALVHIVDDDELVRESLGDLLRSTGYQAALYGSAAEFVNAKLPDVPACLVLDVRLPGSSGLELQEYLTRVNIRLPVILMTGFADIAMSVKAMKAGAIDFLTKPIR